MACAANISLNSLIIHLHSNILIHFVNIHFAAACERPIFEIDVPGCINLFSAFYSSRKNLEWTLQLSQPTYKTFCSMRDDGIKWGQSK